MSFDAAQAIFNQVDTNRDGQIDANEFRSWVSNGANAGASSFDAAAFNSSAAGGASSFDAAAFSSSAAGGASSFDAASFNSSAAVSQYAADTQGHFLDPSPLVTRTVAAGCPGVHTRNIQVRYLQPPRLEAHGGLTVQEVRPPQPPVPPPAYFRRVDPAPRVPPPLVLRERAPVAPPRNPPRTQTVTLRNPPVPPRSVVRDITLAPPARPRDIHVELWRPYQARAQTATRVIRAPPAVPYPAPRNRIIIRECPPPRISHNVQRLGEVQMNPETYNQQYGGSLLDAAEIQRQIRAAGIPEFIVSQIGFSASSGGAVAFSQESSSFSSAGNLEGEFGVGGAGESSSYFSSSSFSSGDSFGVGAGVDGAFGGVDAASAVVSSSESTQEGTFNI